MIELIHKELSGKIIGCLFEVHNQLGSGLLERYYQKALAVEFKRKGLNFKEQVSVPIYYYNKTVGRRQADFVIENVVILEIKKDHMFSRQHIEQVKSYLISMNLQLALLANFTGSGVKFKRIVNIY